MQENAGNPCCVLHWGVLRPSALSALLQIRNVFSSVAIAFVTTVSSSLWSNASQCHQRR